MTADTRSSTLRRRTCSRSAWIRRWPTTSPRRCWTASTATTGCSAPSRRAPSTASRPPTGTASSAPSASASSSTTCASRRRRRGWRRNSRPASSRWTCGSRSSCTTSACWSTTTSPSWPRPSSTRSPPRSCTARYFHNDFIFVRPAVSTEYIENDEPAACRPTAPTTRRARRWRDTIVRIVDNFQLQRPFEDLQRDADYVLEAMQRAPAPGQAARQLPDPGAVVPVLSATRAPTWSARSSTASTSCRSRCRSCTTRRAS